MTDQQPPLLTSEEDNDEAGEAVALIMTLYEALDTLRSIESSDITIPGPAERWRQALQEAYQAHGALETMLDDLLAEVEFHQSRDHQAEDQLE
jgi:hypothetical protein